MTCLASHHVVYYPKAIHSPRGAEQDVPMLLEEPRTTAPIVPVPMGIKTPITLRTMVAWDYPSDVIAEVGNFRIYSGPSSYRYTTSSIVGKVFTNSFAWIRGTTNFLVVTAISTNGMESDYSNELRIPVNPLTNIVITVTSTLATNLQWSHGLSGPWTKIGATNWSQTNPPPLFWRAMGRSMTSKAMAYISRRIQ